jgi:nicotinate-nucleotide pyrophosphorylase (carboxylating)
MRGVSQVWLRETVARALAEDLGAGDITTGCMVDPAAKGRAVLMSRSGAVLAGTQAFEEVYSQVGGVEIDWRFSDGDEVPAGADAAAVKGSLESILTGERTALNFLMHLSGIASLTSVFAKAVAHTKCRITDTRKTTPGLRALEKAAVLAGGGYSHRSGLFDGILIKDNHIAAAGSVAVAVKRAKAAAPHTMKIEVEVGRLGELHEAIEAGADVVMLDNMEPEDARRAVEMAGGRVILEASGNMTPERARLFAEAGVDLISAGALTHSAPAADFSLKIRKGVPGRI